MLNSSKPTPRPGLFYSKKLAPSYKKASIHWVMSAKREDTRQRRLKILIESSEQEMKIPLLRVSKKK